MWPGVRGEEVPHAGHLHAEVVDRAFPVLLPAAAVLRVRNAVSEAAGPAGRRGGAVGLGGAVDDSAALQLRVPVPAAEVPAVPAEDRRDCVGLIGRLGHQRADQLALSLRLGFWGHWCRRGFGHFLVGFGVWSVCVHGFWWVPSHLVRFLFGSLFWALGVC